MRSIIHGNFGEPVDVFRAGGYAKARTKSRRSAY